MQPDPDPSAPPIGVLIPTYNRVEHLVRTLEHLEAQTCRTFEVVVVDDGSTDGTLAALHDMAAKAWFPIRVHAQPNGGPARARNQGIMLMRAPVTVMIGDDTYPCPDFLRLHLEHHRAAPALGAAALGRTRWGETGQVVTPFMRWMEMNGGQFAYRELMDGQTPDWRHFYTSNLSVKTELLRRNPFSEAFPRAAMEDIELGYRLEQGPGLALSFLPDAVVEHIHPTTFIGACRRAVHAGEGGAILAGLWPELRGAPESAARRALRAMVTSPAVLPVLTYATAAVTAVWCPNPLMPRLLRSYNDLGYRRAESALARVQQ